MDPLTHTLVGSSLSATKLGSKTRLATAALVIGANLPDVDVLGFVNGADAALGFRRGWTHGVLALAILPALLAGMLLVWARVRPGSPDRLTSPAWLFGLCYLAVLTHPVLDWLNVYGMRWLMPFSETWYYGDSVFIIDPWLWLFLGTGYLLGRKPSRGPALLGAALIALLFFRILRRAPLYIWPVLVVLLLLLAAFLWTPRWRRFSAARSATVGLGVSAIFIVSMITLHSATTKRVTEQLEPQGPIDQLMVGPLPVNPTAWEYVVESEGRIRHGRLSWLHGSVLEPSGFDQPSARHSALWPELETSDQSPGFFIWARFPWMDRDGDQIYLMDARYARQRTTGFGGTVLQLPAPSTP